MTPTKEQEEIIANAAKGKSLIVNACAGSGKSTTLKAVIGEMKRTRPNARILACMFNKSAQTDFSGGLATGMADVRTTHSLAWGAIVKPNPGFRRKIFECGNLTKTKIVAGGISEFAIDDPHVAMSWASYGTGKLSKGNRGFDIWHVAARVREAFDRFLISDDMEIGEKHVWLPWGMVRDFSDRGNAGDFKKWHSAYRAHIVENAKKLWRLVADPDNDMPMPHDGYLKLWQMQKPKLRYDILLIDEAQDTNPVMLDILRNNSEKQIIYVGDDKQSIYAFRGATNAMEDARNAGGFEDLWLTKSFRFGQPIADIANGILRHSANPPKRIHGHDVWPSRVAKSAPTPYALLCRSNAGVLESVLHYVSNGVTPNVVGDMRDAANMLESAVALKNGQKRDVRHSRIRDFDTWEMLLDETDRDPDLARMARLAEDGDYAKHIVDTLRTLKNNKSAPVTISTAHKAKGLEWDNVVIAGDFRPPFDETKKPNEQEINLLYVAATRAHVCLATNETIDVLCG